MSSLFPKLAYNGGEDEDADEDTAERRLAREVTIACKQKQSETLLSRCDASLRSVSIWFRRESNLWLTNGTHGNQQEVERDKVVARRVRRGYELLVPEIANVLHLFHHSILEFKH